MKSVLVHFPTATATAHLAAGDPSRLSGLAVPFGVASSPAMDGRRYRFSHGPTNVDDPIDVVQDHDENALAGRLESWDVDDAGMTAHTRLYDTTRGRDVATEAAEGARAGFSVGASFDPATLAEDNDGVINVDDWTATHLAVVRRPAFADAGSITVHHSATPTRKEPMTTTPEAPPVVELPTIAELAAAVAEHLTPTEVHVNPLAEFASFPAFCAALADAGEDTDKARRLQAAFAVGDQVLDNNPGVQPPNWRTDIKMRLDKRRPAITRLGTIGLPPKGMDDSWPYFDGSIDTMIHDQAAELADLDGIRVDIKKATQAIKTAGTVSTISYQLLLRSDPAYLAAYLMISQAAWARYTEKQFEDALAAGGTRVGAMPALTAKAFRALLFAASADVEDATGAPADTALVDSATFKALGGQDDLSNAKYGTQNVPGTASASTLQIDVNGLQITRAPFLPDSTTIVTNGEAAKFPESGAQVATAEDVVKLGRNVATWGMYEPAHIYFPAGVRVYRSGS